MKKYKIQFTIVCLAISSLTACSDFLEADTKSFWKEETFYSSKQEVDIALAGIYSQLSNDQVYGWVFNVLIEGGTDETYTNDGTPNWEESKYGFNSSSASVKNVWLNFYSCIHLVNKLEKI